MPTACYDRATGNLLGIQRPVAAIYADLAALSVVDFNAVWADLSVPVSGINRYLASEGPNAGVIAALDWVVTDSGAVAASLIAARLRLAALFVQDNPRYLEAPSFAPSINVPGYT